MKRLFPMKELTEPMKRTVTIPALTAQDSQRIWALISTRLDESTDEPGTLRPARVRQRPTVSYGDEEAVTGGIATLFDFQYREPDGVPSVVAELPMGIQEISPPSPSYLDPQMELAL